MPYGKRRYGRTVRPASAPADVSSVPTFVCSHCGKVKNQSPKTINLTAVRNNAIFISGRICDECGVSFQDWFKK